MEYIGVFLVNFKHIPHLFSSVSIVDFEQANICWGKIKKLIKHSEEIRMSKDMRQNIWFYLLT